MHIEIESTEVEERENRAGTMTMRNQFGYMWKAGEKYPVKVQLPLINDSPAYPPGKYVLHDDSFETDQYGGIKLGFFSFRLEQLPVAGNKKVS